MESFGKALVTGGAGFIGSHLVDRLIGEGHEVCIFDDFSTGSLANLEESLRSSSLTFVKGNINDREVLREAIKGVDVVFHEAAVTPSVEKPLTPSYLHAVNVTGTINLLEASVRAGVKKFVFASSAEVYGNPKTLPMTEDLDPTPVSPNGWSKLLGERACFEFASKTGLEVVALRYFNVYGKRSPVRPPQGVINEFAERLLSMESPAIYGKGVHSRDFVHVEDVVSANILAAQCRSQVGMAYNIGSAEHITIEKLAELESRILLGDNVIIPLDYKLARQIDIPNVYGDVSRAKSYVGFVPKYSIESGLEEYLGWLKNSLSVEIERPIPTRKLQ